MAQPARQILLQQHPVARVSGLVILIVAMVPLVLVVTQGWFSFEAVVGSVAWAALFATIGVRNWRGAVVLSKDSIYIRGQLWSRRIDRSAVVGVTEHSWLQWRGRSGSTRYSPLVIFWDPGSPFPQFMAHSIRCLEVIELWCRGVDQDALGAPNSHPE